MHASSQSDNAGPLLGRKAYLMVGLLAALVLGLWAFPWLWYSKTERTGPRLWLSERRAIDGWTFREVPVSERAEAILVADRTFSGEYQRSDNRTTVNVFSAKRYSEKADEIGLFMHTPDRCWTDGGWSLEPVSPEHLELEVNGLRMRFERRLFAARDGHLELTYFGGLVGGQPVPYRLDHNLSVGMKRALRRKAGSAESGVRAADTHFWARVWQGFLERSPLVGPKQFVRVSTRVVGGDVAAADRVLTDFLGRWLEPSDYAAELKAWHERPQAQG